MNKQKLKRRGFMFVLSSPSGAGKTTLSRMLLESDKNIVMSISATTRQKRPDEIEGKDYFFVSKERFDQMAENDEFLENAKVFDNSYGTPRKMVDDALDLGSDVLFDIDWQGTKQLAKKRRDDLVSVFILPPSMKELENRLKNRAQDSEEVIKKRMAKANDEISHWDSYDYVVINSDLEDSLKKISAILQSERQKRIRQQGLAEFVKMLLKKS